MKISIISCLVVVGIIAVKILQVVLVLIYRDKVLAAAGKASRSAGCLADRFIPAGKTMSCGLP